MSDAYQRAEDEGMKENYWIGSLLLDFLPHGMPRPSFSLLIALQAPQRLTLGTIFGVQPISNDA